MTTPELARPEDLPEIVAIYNSTINSRQVTADLQPVSVASRQAWFDAHQQPHRPLYVWRDDAGSIIAWGSFSDYYPRDAYRITAEISIYLHENQRGCGLGRTILQQMLTHAPTLGIRNVIAVVFAHNAPSLRLFETAGFTIWGRLPAVCDLQSQLADVVILGKAI